MPREYYGERQQVYFYYLNAGEEIARVEVPQWVAEDEDLLALGHRLIVEQCRKGQGYPVVISEAHEQAVVSGRDRQLFKQMVAETLERAGRAPTPPRRSVPSSGPGCDGGWAPVNSANTAGRRYRANLPPPPPITPVFGTLLLKGRRLTPAAAPSWTGGLLPGAPVGQ